MRQSVGLSLVLLLAAPLPAPAQGQSAEPAPLAFLGFRPGSPLTEVADRVRALNGREFRCQRARTDPALAECRGSLVDPIAANPVTLWLSAMDSLCGVLTVSGQLSAEQLTAWRTSLEDEFGVVGARAQGPQWSMQWVRRGRMLRLTWRVDARPLLASVSLVDGGVLDRWGRQRDRRSKSRN
jgi:hypothetical protein